MEFYCSIYKKSFGILFLLCPFYVSGQKPVFLAPQPHKLLYADTVYQQALAKKDTLLLAEAFYLYGKTYEATGDNVTSQRWFLKSLRILEPRGDSPSLSRLYNKIAGNEFLYKHYKEALYYARHCISIAQRTGSSINLCRGYDRMAHIHYTDWSEGGKKADLPKPMLDSVLYYFKKSESIAIQSNDSLALASINSNLGNFFWTNYHDKKRFLSHLNTALIIYTKKKKDIDRINVLHSLISYYLATRQYNAARNKLMQAQEIYDKNPTNVYYLKHQFEALYSTYYQLTGNWKKAFDHNEKLRQMQIANYMTERDVAVLRLGKEYDIEKKDAQIKAKDTELTLRSVALTAQQRFTAVSIILLIFTGVMSFIFFRLYKKNQRVSHQNELLVREQNHRVKNNLQVVSSLLSLQSDALTDINAIKAIEESRLRVETMAILHRKLYDGKQLAQVYIPDFLEELTEGVLSTYGHGDIELELWTDPLYLSADKALHVGLILNELVTNACKYAFPTSDSPTLTITCRKYKVKNQNFIHLKVADNGSDPYDSIQDLKLTSTINKSTGFGMMLIKMETEQLYAKYDFTYDHGIVFEMHFKEEGEFKV